MVASVLSFAFCLLSFEWPWPFEFPWPFNDAPAARHSPQRLGSSAVERRGRAADGRASGTAGGVGVDYDNGLPRVGRSEKPKSRRAEEWKSRRTEEPKCGRAGRSDGR